MFHFITNEICFSINCKLRLAFDYSDHVLIQSIGSVQLLTNICKLNQHSKRNNGTISVIRKILESIDEFN